MKRLVKLAVAAWILRWITGELAAYAGRHWQAHGPAPRDSAVKPGWMPGPSAERLRRFADP